jgi:hypothetical protein
VCGSYAPSLGVPFGRTPFCGFIHGVSLGRSSLSRLGHIGVCGVVGVGLADLQSQALVWWAWGHRLCGLWLGGSSFSGFGVGGSCGFKYKCRRVEN